MSITLDILTALAEWPDGEAPVANIKQRLVDDAMRPGRLAGFIGELSADPLARHQLRGGYGLQSLFSNGLVERPRPGVWKLTAKGREHLTGFKASR